MDKYQAKLEQIIKRAERVVESHSRLKAEHETLKEEHQQLLALLKEQGEKIEELEHGMQVVKVARQLSAFPDEEKTELKKKINEYIKEIDKCVALLND